MYLFYACVYAGITSPLMYIFWHMQMYARVHASVHENVHAEGSCLCVCVFAYANTRKCMRVRTGAQASQQVCIRTSKKKKRTWGQNRSTNRVCCDESEAEKNNRKKKHSSQKTLQIGLIAGKTLKTLFFWVRVVCGPYATSVWTRRRQCCKELVLGVRRASCDRSVLDRSMC